MEFKYVVMVDRFGKESMHIFPKSFNHDCVAEVISLVKDNLYGNWTRLRLEPVSAGFTDLKTCYGCSESLGLECRTDLDTKLLNGLL